MKKAILLISLIGLWFLFQLQGCEKTITETEIVYDTIYVFDTTYIDTSVHTDSTYERPNLYLYVFEIECSNRMYVFWVDIINPDEFPAFNIQLHAIAHIVDGSSNEIIESRESSRNVTPLVLPPLTVLQYYSYVFIDCYPDSIQPTWETILDTCWISWNNQP